MVYEFNLSSALGSGSIALGALEGENRAGGLVDFSFTTTWFDPDFTFDASMVDTIRWSIDPSSFALLLELDTLTEKLAGLDRDLSIDTLGPLFDPVASCSGAEGSGRRATIQICASQGLGTTHAQSRDLAATPLVSRVSEPASLPLLGLGFAALTSVAFWFRRAAAIGATPDGGRAGRKRRARWRATGATRVPARGRAADPPG
jgi:hypothetical protein